MAYGDSHLMQCCDPQIDGRIGQLIDENKEMRIALTAIRKLAAQPVVKTVHLTSIKNTIDSLKYFNQEDLW